jgi:CheY-like chemotaxis protein
MTDPTENRTVLVVDDDPDLADMFALWLNRAGYEVRTAYGGEAALDRLDPAVDIVLLDRRMPRRPGDEVLEAVRGRPGEYHVSMVTAVEPEPDILDLPFNEYLTKPIGRTELVDAVDRLAIQDSLDDDLQELYLLSSTLSALERSEAVEGEAQELGSWVESKQAAIGQKLERLEDPEAAFALLESPE